MKKTLLFTCLAILLVQLDVTILYIAFGSITKSFQEVSTSQLSWVLNIYTLVFGSLLIPSGVAGDIYGRKKVFLLGVAIFTLASLLCGLSTSVEMLIAMRLLQAVGSSLLVPSSLGILLDSSPADFKTTSVSLWGASAALGAAIGPALGGILVTNYGWHSIFFVNVPIGIAICLSLYNIKTNSKPSGLVKLPSFVGVILIIFTMVLLSFGMLSEGRQGFSPEQFIYLGMGIIVLIFFIWHSKKSSRPLLHPELFKNGSFNTSNIASFIYFSAFAIIFFGQVQSLINEWGLSLADTGLYLLPGPLVVIPSAILSGRYAKNNGYRGLIVAGTLFVITGILYQRLGMNYVHSIFSVWMIGWLFVGIGNGMVMPSLSGSATIGLQPHLYAMGSGVNNSIRQFGTMVGITIAVSFIHSGQSAQGSYQKMFFLTCALNIIVVVLAIYGNIKAKEKL